MKRVSLARLFLFGLSVLVWGWGDSSYFASWVCGCRGGSRKEENSFMNCQWWHGATVHISILAFATVRAAVEKKKFLL